MEKYNDDLDDYPEYDEPGEENLDSKTRNDYQPLELQIWYEIKVNHYDCLPHACPGYKEPGWSKTPKGKKAFAEYGKKLDRDFEEEAEMSMEAFLKKYPTFHSFEKMVINHWVKEGTGKFDEMGRKIFSKALTKVEKILLMVEDKEKYLVAEKGIGQLFWEVGYGRVKFIERRFEAKHLAILDLVNTKISNEGYIRELIEEKKLPVSQVGFSKEDIEDLIKNFDTLSASERAMFFPEYIILTENEIRKVQRGNPTSKMIEDMVDKLLIIAIKKSSIGKIFFDDKGWQPVTVSGTLCSTIIKIGSAEEDKQWAEYKSNRKRRGKGKGYEDTYVLFFNTRMAAYFFNNLRLGQLNILPMEFNKIVSPLANILARMLILHAGRRLTLRIATRALGWSEKTDAYDRIRKIEKLLTELKDKGIVIKGYEHFRKKRGTIEDTYWDTLMHKQSPFITMAKSENGELLKIQGEVIQDPR